MPGSLSGLELARQIALRHTTGKIVFMTSDSDETLSDAGPLDPDAIVLHKTYTKAILVAAISRALE